MSPKRLVPAWLLAIALPIVALHAQDAPIRIELGGGHFVHGAVQQVEDDAMVVRLSTGTVRVPLRDIDTVRQDLRTPAGTGQRGDAVAGDDLAIPHEAASFPRGPDRELMRFVERYLWFVPSTEGHRTSVGAAMLVVLVLLVQLAARMANLESRTLGRAAVFATIVLAMIIVELTFVPVSPVLIGAIGGFDLAMWFALGMLIFEADAFQGAVLLASFLLSTMVGILLLQLAGVLMHADQMLI